MDSPSDTALPETAPSRRARFAVRGVLSAGFGVLIGFGLTILTGVSLGSSLVYSVCISVACWFSIDTLRVPVARWQSRHTPRATHEAHNDWPGWPLMMGVVLAGTFVGSGFGAAVAGWITGHAAGAYPRSGWPRSLGLLVIAMVPGTVITYWFYSRETLAVQQAAMQTAQRLAAEHQLKLLESQLEPHMLFNTLANLRVLIGTDPPRALAMLDQLILFLRTTLDGSRNPLHPLRAEFARLADYLALMQVRMGDRLQAHFDLPDALADMPVPPLLLQPLVENCIKHGLEPAVAGGRIDVTATRDGADLVLRVRDTGAGLSDAASDGTKFGLPQVRERLVTLYGARASLRLQDAVDAEGGTLATIRLPLSTQ
jgi:hypothetical protein